MNSDLLRDLVYIAEECVLEFHERVKDAKSIGNRKAAANFTQSIRGYNSTIREARREILKLEDEGKPHPYTVLLLYPDYRADEFGHDTYLAHVRAANHSRAVKLAQRKARRAQGEAMEKSSSFEDFYPLLVLKGHHDETQG